MTEPNWNAVTEIEDGVFEDGNGWWFLDEQEAANGPYPTEVAAIDAQDEYILSLGPQLADTPENAGILGMFQRATAQHPEGTTVCAQCALNGKSYAVIDGKCSNPNCPLNV